MKIKDKWIKDEKFENYGVLGEWKWNFEENKSIVEGGRIEREQVEDESERRIKYGEKRKKEELRGFIRNEKEWRRIKVNSYIGIG